MEPRQRNVCQEERSPACDRRAYEIATIPDTLGEYFATWIERHPRSERTNATYEHRVSRVTEVEIEGIALKDWPMHELRRRHTLALVDHMLTNEGRATTGAVGILRSLSAMAEDAITDEVCDLNPFKGIRIRANDPRAKKKRRPIRVFSFERTKTDHGEADAGRVVPVPATLAWMLEAQINLNGPDCRLIFTTPSGRMWRERNFYRDVWKPTQQASGLDIRPHECRHSYVTHLRAAGVNDADLAEIAGHRVETMLARYTHAVGESFSSVRRSIG